MNRRSFLKMLSTLPLVAPLVKLPKNDVIMIDKEFTEAEVKDLHAKWDGLGNSCASEDGENWEQVGFAPDYSLYVGGGYVSGVLHQNPETGLWEEMPYYPSPSPSD